MKSSKKKYEKQPKDKGRLRTIRESLGITARQLADRCGVVHSSILSIEKNEVLQKASIESINKIALAMDCKVVYDIVPRVGYSRLEQIIDERSKIVARRIFKKINHSMALENQKIPPKVTERQIKKLACELKNKKLLLFWNE